MLCETSSFAVLFYRLRRLLISEPNVQECDATTLPKELNVGYIITIPQKQKPPMNEHRGNN